MAKGRSPSYPGVGLDEAVELVETLYEQEGRAPVAPEVAVQAWDYKGLSGPSRRKLAALRYYGLLADANSDVQLTDLALSLLHPKSEEERLENLRKAALNPDIFREIQERYGTGSDQSIAAHLVRDRGFNENGARKFVEAFRATQDVARLNEISYTDADVSADEDEGEEERDRLYRPRGKHRRRQVGVDHNQDVYPLPDGREAVFQWPERLSLAEFEDLEKWIALVMGKVKRWTELKEHLRAEDGGEGEP